MCVVQVLQFTWVGVTENGNSTGSALCVCVCVCVSVCVHACMCVSVICVAYTNNHLCVQVGIE